MERNYLSCAHEVTTALLTVPSVQDARVNTCTGQASLTYKGVLIELGKIAKRTTDLTVVGSSDEAPKLLVGVEILNTSCTALGTVFDVQYDPTMTWLKFPKKYNIFLRTPISFILCILLLVFAWAPIKPHPIVYAAVSLFLATYRFMSADLSHSRHGCPRYTLLYDPKYNFLCHLCGTSHGPRFSTLFFETPTFLLTLISINELIGALCPVGLVGRFGQVIRADLTQANDELRISNTLVPTDGIVIRGNTIAEISELAAHLEELRVRNEGSNYAVLGALQCTIVVLVLLRLERECCSELRLDMPKDTAVAVFDKTGTLTLCLRLLSQIPHPRVPTGLSPDKARSISGKASKGRCPTEFSSAAVAQADPLYAVIIANALTMFAVTSDGKLIAFFGLADLPPPSAQAAVQLPQAQGIEVHIASGDAAPVVQARAGGAARRLARVRARRMTACGESHTRVRAAGGGSCSSGKRRGDTPALAVTDVARATADIALLAPDVARALAARVHQLCVGVRLQPLCGAPHGECVCAHPARASAKW
ncbi:hypothetical protein BJY52DRAFT_1220995 [Lactarius psammicola]|nr:hypothetical protein BJY52DRAFT_1220995 [Lactarius psammicola]